MDEGSNSVSGHLRTKERSPEAILRDPDVWCSSCSKMQRASGVLDGVCWECRGLDGPDELAEPLTKEERDAVIHVDGSLRATWTVKRDEWHGTDDEWRDLIRACRDELPRKECDRIYEEAAERFGEEIEARAHFGPEVELHVRPATPSKGEPPK